jgi:hypothetical protein
LNCSNEFVTLAASDALRTSDTEVTKPFFTSLVVENFRRGLAQELVTSEKATDDDIAAEIDKFKP